MGTGRFDHLADGKPRELKDYVLDEVADDLVKELREFPPPVSDWADPGQEERFREVLQRLTRPSLETYRVACEIARLELLREIEVIDRFFRGPQVRALLPDALEEKTAHFVTRFLVESALAFQDFAQGKFGREDLVRLIEKIEDRLLRGYRLRLLEPSAP